jgi:hypothetical protein
MIDYLRFYVPLKNFSLTWTCHYCRWRAVKVRPMLGAPGLWAGRYLHRATPSVTRDLTISGLIRRTALLSRLLRHTRGYGRSILTRNITDLLISIFAILDSRSSMAVQRIIYGKNNCHQISMSHTPNFKNPKEDMLHESMNYLFKQNVVEYV